MRHDRVSTVAYLVYRAHKYSMMIVKKQDRIGCDLFSHYTALDKVVANPAERFKRNIVWEVECFEVNLLGDEMSCMYQSPRHECDWM